MKYKLLYIAIVVSSTVIMSACGKKEEQPKEVSVSVRNEEPSQSDVSLTDAQKKSLNVTIGKMPTYKFNGLIEANGTLSVMPQSEASVSPYIGANVKTIMVKEGQSVRRGQVLAYLSHPDLLDLQSRYLASYNRMKFVTQEYNRQKQLYTEKIGSGKDFQQIQAEYKSLNAELRTTESQLNLIGINPTSVRNGKTIMSIAVKSPISGTVEKISIKTGQFADSQTPMFRIVNINNVYADLLVFEKDVPMVKVGQKVLLSLKSATGVTYTGKVYSVGTTFDSNPKAVHVRASIDGIKRGLIVGMYLCGKIESETKKLVAIPEEGVVDDSGKSYVFSVTHQNSKWLFHPIEVKKGRTENGYVEIVNAEKISNNTIFALDNAYYILSEMKKNETGEE
ncbi:MAG: efflux RND transporter periplasmic adaptor subunit [Parabacteroides sp.]|jgi:cobalt-zinc-cadmium efflux system membrane fusion protein|nr:efflux RND transporter periplasmic adaptor subunit [Parabacteroides sp.]